MRRGAARRVPPPRALVAPILPVGTRLARRLHSLAGLIDDTLTFRGALPAFADATRGAASSGLRTKALDVRNGAGTARNGRADHGASDGSTNHHGDRTDGIGEGHSADIAEDHIETWRLVEKAQLGDGEAFGLLYDRYVDMVYRFVYYRINDRTLAEDFTSETFLRALRRISTISYQGRDIGAWFVTIARNIVLDHMKSARHRLETSTGDPVESKEHAPSTENAVLTSLQNEQLMAAVAQLGDEQRECVTLRFVHGRSVSETADIMGKNDGAIKALQHRAVRKLADLVDRP